MIPEQWIALRVRSRSAGPDNLLADALVRLGGRAVLEEEGAYTTFLPAPDDRDEFLAHSAAHLREWSGRDDLEVSWWWQAHRDWRDVWRRGLAPVRVTDRIVVAPSWEAFRAGPEEIVITIDPGMAFGTAGHATTRGCLRLLERATSPGERVLDVGTGSGILAIAAAKLGARHVQAIDSDPYACEAAFENVLANGADPVVTVACEAAGLDGSTRQGFDGVVANIEWEALRPILPALRAALVPKGRWLVLGGILATQAAAAAEAAAALGLLPAASDVEDEWWAGLFQSRRPG